MRNYYYDTGFSEDLILKRQTKSEIKFYSCVAAWGILGFFLLREIYSVLLMLTGTFDFFNNDELANQSSSMLVIIICILVPFFIGASFQKKRTGTELLPLDAPKDKGLFLLAMPAGVGICMAASYVTSYLTYFIDLGGIHLTQPDLTSPARGFSLVIYILRLTVVAAVIEEVTMRGIIMQPLRRYGAGFALAMSSMVFALLHCNLIQAPFAFIAGLAIGYFTMATGTMWAGILIHMLNNAVSGIAEYLLAVGKEELANSVTSYISYAFMALGLICLILFRIKKGSFSLNEKNNVLTVGEKVRSYILTVPMIIAIIAVCYYTSFFVSFSR